MPAESTRGGPTYEDVSAGPKRRASDSDVPAAVTKSLPRPTQRGLGLRPATFSSNCGRRGVPKRVTVTTFQRTDGPHRTPAGPPAPQHVPEGRSFPRLNRAPPYVNATPR